MRQALRLGTAAAVLFSASMFGQQRRGGYIPPDQGNVSISNDFYQGFHTPFDQLERMLATNAPSEAVHEEPAGTVSIDQLRHPLSAKAERLIQNGLKYAQTGAHEKAIDEFRQALAEPTSIPYARSLLGAECLKTGNLSAATTELSEAVRLMPNEAANHSNLGYAYLLTGKRVAAEEELREAIRLDRNSPQPRYLLGLLLLDQGTPEAADNLTFAQKVFKRARLALAIFHIQHGQSADAEEDLRAYLGPEWSEKGPEFEIWASSAAQTGRPSALFGLPEGMR